MLSAWSLVEAVVLWGSMCVQRIQTKDNFTSEYVYENPEDGEGCQFAFETWVEGIYFLLRKVLLEEHGVPARSRIRFRTGVISTL